MKERSDIPHSVRHVFMILEKQQHNNGNEGEGGAARGDDLVVLFCHKKNFGFV